MFWTTSGFYFCIFLFFYQVSSKIWFSNLVKTCKQVWLKQEVLEHKKSGEVLVGRQQHHYKLDILRDVGHTVSTLNLNVYCPKLKAPCFSMFLLLKVLWVEQSSILHQLWTLPGKPYSCKTHSQQKLLTTTWMVLDSMEWKGLLREHLRIGETLSSILTQIHTYKYTYAYFSLLFPGKESH